MGGAWQGEGSQCVGAGISTKGLLLPLGQFYCRITDAPQGLCHLRPGYKGCGGRYGGGGGVRTGGAEGCHGLTGWRQGQCGMDGRRRAKAAGPVAERPGLGCSSRAGPRWADTCRSPCSGSGSTQGRLRSFGIESRSWLRCASRRSRRSFARAPCVMAALCMLPSGARTTWEQGSDGASRGREDVGRS